MNRLIIHVTLHVWICFQTLIRDTTRAVCYTYLKVHCYAAIIKL